MIIIADSGSTKTDWCVVNHGKQVKRITTEGTNPFGRSENRCRLFLWGRLCLSRKE